MAYNDIIADAQLYLPLQEETGNIGFDASGNGRNLTLSGSGFNFANNSTAGPTNWLPRALEATGSSSQVAEVPDHVDLRGGGQVSLCGWVDHRDEGYLDIASKGTNFAEKDWSLGVTGTNINATRQASFLAETGNTPVNPTADIVDGWLFVAATYDNATGVAILYINGVQVATETDAGKSPASTSPVALFRQQYGTNSRNGAVAGIGMWNRILTPEEITALYQGPSKPWLYRSPGVVI